MWEFELTNRAVDDIMMASKFTISCAREPWTSDNPYDLIRYCEDEKEVQEAVVDYIACGYEIIDVRPYNYSDENENAELKPCPFCGGEGMVEYFNPSEGFTDDSGIYYIACLDCGSETSKRFKTERNAREAWNTRSYESLVGDEWD